MKKTSHFLASVVFSSEQKSISLFQYPNATISEEPVEVNPHPAGGNCVLIENCHFNAHLSQNKGVIPTDSGKTHIVTDETAVYNLVAYLEIGSDKVLANSIPVGGYLPKGLEMNLIEAFTDADVYTFSGLSLMLFDDIPNFNNAEH